MNSNYMILAIFSALVAIVLIPTPADSQVNIEKMRNQSGETGLSGAVGLDLSVKSGSVDVTTLEHSGRVNYTGESFLTFLITRTELGWKDGDRYSNKSLVHLRTARRLSGRVQLEGFAQYNYDRPRLLELRYLGGVGFRFQVLEWESVSAWLGTAYMLEHERLESQPVLDHPREVTAHRWSNYLSLRAELNSRVGLSWTLYVQPMFEDFKDVRALTDSSLKVELGGALYLNVTSRLHFDNRPPRDIDELDVSLQTGLTVEF